MLGFQVCAQLCLHRKDLQNTSRQDENPSGTLTALDNPKALSRSNLKDPAQAFQTPNPELKDSVLVNPSPEGISQETLQQ